MLLVFIRIYQWNSDDFLIKSTQQDYKKNSNSDYVIFYIYL
jgi:hypothetical protein